MKEEEVRKLEARYRKAGFDPDVTLPATASPEDHLEYSRLVKLVKSAKVEAERRRDVLTVQKIDEYRALLKRVAKGRAIQRALNKLEGKAEGVMLTPWPDPPPLPPPQL